MKKSIVFVLLLIAVMTAMLVSCGSGDGENGGPTVTPPAGGDETGGVQYTLSEDKSYATVTGYTGSDTKVVIADEYKGVPVTGISDEAFSWCEKLTEVSVPESVRSFGNRAFWGCISLERVNIPSGVTFIGESAFSCCYKLGAITVPSGVTELNDSVFYSCESLSSIEILGTVTYIGERAFSCCEALDSFVIFDSVTEVGESAFSYCTSLRTVEIGSGLTEISNGLFYGCEALTSVRLPDGIVTVGESAFRFCRKISSVIIGKGVSEIGDGAFAYCDALESFEVSEENVSFASLDGNLYSKTFAKLIRYAQGKNETSFEIPETVYTVEDGAFLSAKNLERIIIPAGVSYIYTGAFDSCTSLKEFVVDANNVCYLAEDGNLYSSVYNSLVAYAIGKTDESFTLPEWVTGIEMRAVTGSSSLKSVYIHDGVTTMSTWAFEFCPGLTIYCEAESEPDEWSSFWYDEECSVVWGFKGEV